MIRNRTLAKRSPLGGAWRDLYNSPTTQNEYGYVQASKSVSGIRHPAVI